MSDGVQVTLPDGIDPLAGRSLRVRACLSEMHENIAEGSTQHCGTRIKYAFCCTAVFLGCVLASLAFSTHTSVVHNQQQQAPLSVMQRDDEMERLRARVSELEETRTRETRVSEAHHRAVQFAPALYGTYPTCVMLAVSEQ